MAVLLCGAVALTNVVGGVWSYRRLKEALVREELIRQDAAADALAPQFTTSLQALRADAQLLTKVPATTGLVRAQLNGGYDELETSSELQWRRRLTVIFRETLHSRPGYLQVRLIGVADGGREIIRVERQGGVIPSTPAEMFQRKGDRPYFRAAIELPAGAVYVSEIELNEEWAGLAEPRIPVVRAASPVYDAAGKVFGAVVPRILAGPVGITRAFQNLISNAFKYGCGGLEPRIEIGSRMLQDEVRFFVRDNGGGIPEEYQHKIFGLFQRLDTSQEGTGIGLAIVSKIMEVQGGRVWVESKPSQGTTFWLSFPSSVVAPSSTPALTGGAT